MRGPAPSLKPTMRSHRSMTFAPLLDTRMLRQQVAIYEVHRANRNMSQSFVSDIACVNKTRTETRERDGERGNARLIVERQIDELACKNWSGRRESNPRMQLGKLPFYH